MLLPTDYFNVLLASAADQATGGGAGPLNGSKAILFTNDITLTRATQISDLVQPTYTGYATQAVTWSTPGRDALGNISSTSQTMLWQEATTASSVLIYGIAFTDSPGTNLLAAEKFATPIPLNTLLDQLFTSTQWIWNNNNSGQTTIVP